MEKVKIKYLYNSGFTIETKNHFFVFDYFKDSRAHSIRSELNHKKNVIVFSSHGHEDHFNAEIFSWREAAGSIKYVLSSDIAIDDKTKDIYFMSKGEELNLGDVYITAYGSTDIGISFIVKTEGITIFHAGDLNCWSWYDETLEENKLAEEAFRNEIENLKAEYQGRVDIAFFPVDPRLKERYDKGVIYFAREIKPYKLVPMHFGDNYKDIESFSKSFEVLGVKVLNPEKLN